MAGLFFPIKSLFTQTNQLIEDYEPELFLFILKLVFWYTFFYLLSSLLGVVAVTWIISKEVDWSIRLTKSFMLSAMAGTRFLLVLMIVTCCAWLSAKLVNLRLSFRKALLLVGLSFIGFTWMMLVFVVSAAIQIGILYLYIHANLQFGNYDFLGVALFYYFDNVLVYLAGIFCIILLVKLIRQYTHSTGYLKAICISLSGYGLPVVGFNTLLYVYS